METNKENVIAAVTAIAISLKSCPASDSKKMTGKKTAIVVKADATNAPHTSTVPSCAASNGFLPIFKCLSIFSKTTIALSSNIPTAKEIPAREIVLRLLSILFKTIKVATILIGIAAETTAVGKNERRNSRSVMIAKTAPIAMFCCTKSMAPWIYPLWS